MTDIQFVILYAVILFVSSLVGFYLIKIGILEGDDAEIYFVVFGLWPVALCLLVIVSPVILAFLIVNLFFMKKGNK